MDETETVLLCVCVTMSQEDDMILSQHVSQEDMIPSHVYIYVCVVSLIAKLLCKFKPIRLLKPLRKRELSYLQSL